MMQSLNGIWYGAIYLAGGGDILPVIIAHVLYELHIFVGTWKAINDQMDYTEASCQQAKIAAESKKPSRSPARPNVSSETNMAPETVEFGRRFFYTFDHEHKDSLSLADVKRAVSYAFLQDDPVHATVPPSDSQTTAVFYQMIQQRPMSSQRASEERLSLSEFLRLLFVLKSKSWHQGTPRSAPT